MFTGIIDELIGAAFILLLALPAVYVFNYYYEDICCCYSEESIRSLCLLLFLVDSVFLEESINCDLDPF